MEEQNEFRTKKKGNGTTIVIVLLVVAILGLACYICYDKGILFSNKETTTSGTDKKENNNNQIKPEDESVTFSDSELEKYVNYISPASIGPAALLYDTTAINSNSLSTADKIKYIGTLVYSKHTSTSDYQYDVISESDVKNAVEEVYGPNTYEKTTFNLGCGDYTLNENEKNYYSRTGCGGSTATSVSNVVIDYKATKSKLEITTAYAFFDGMTNKIYKDYNKSISLDEYTGSPSEIESSLKSYVKNNKEKLNTIIYTFESSNGINYYFTGFKNNK